MERKLLQELWDVPHHKSKSIQEGILQLRSLCVLLGISMWATVDCVIEYILTEGNQLPFMIHLPALFMKFKAEHIDPVGGKASSTNSRCQFMVEKAVVWH